VDGDNRVKEKSEMSFCKLSTGQKSALTFFKAVEALGNAKLREWVASSQWGKLQTIAELVPDLDAIPSIDDFASVGAMSSGLKDAHFFLLLADMMATADARSKMEDALDTCCWDSVASTMLENASGKLNFSGSDLHRAYAPQDPRMCLGLPSWLRDGVRSVIAAGEAVGHFFSKSLPDFFRDDFSNFFTGPVFDLGRTVGQWTAQQFDTATNAVESGVTTAIDTLGSGVSTAVDTVGNGVETAVEETGDIIEEAGEALDPSNW
jgi:hypothetical protein